MLRNYNSIRAVVIEDTIRNDYMLASALSRKLPVVLDILRLQDNHNTSQIYAAKQVTEIVYQYVIK